MIMQQRTLCYTLILVGTLWTAGLLLAQPQPIPQSAQSPSPLPRAPQNQAEAYTGALTLNLARTTPAKLEQVLRQICPHRFTAESQLQYTFTINRQNVPCRSQLRIDPQSNTAILTGDKLLCDQIFQLLTAIDQPLPPGKGRQIIPYQYTQPDLLVQVLESHRVSTSRPQNRTAVNPLSSSHPIRQVNHQFEGDLLFDPGTATAGQFPLTQQPGDPTAINAVDDFQYRIFPELDSMVIQADDGARLKQFVDMIRQLEELSKQQRPKIEVIYLKHVNNVSLGAIFTQQNQAIYAEIFKTVQGTVRILPMTSPNAILLIGWGDALETAKELVASLDVPIAAEHSRLHIFKLKYIAVTQAQQVIRNTFPAPPPVTVANSGFMERIQVYADTRSNILIVQAAPNELEEVKRVLNEIDVATAAPTLQVKPIKLKHTLAPDLALTLRAAIAATTTDGKSPALELRLQSPEGQKLIQSGIMSDVVIEPDTRNNVIIVRAPKECMGFIEELVVLLDTASPEAEVKIFQIENGDAESLSSMLTTLLPSNIEGTPGPRLPGSADEETLIPLTFAVDRRTNSLLVAGAPGDLKIVEALVNSLDREDQLALKHSVYALKNMKAEPVSETIMNYVNNRMQIRQNSGGVISPYHLIESAVFVVPDVESNTLIISATPKYYDEILQLIKEIDKSPPQVVIRVLIAEVTLSDSKEWAAELGFQDPLLYLRGKVSPGLNFNDPLLPLGNSEVNTGTVGSQLLTSLGAAKENGGVVFSASSDYLNIMLQALHRKDRLEVLSSPQITTMNNVQASVSVGQKVPRYMGMLTDQGVSRPIVEDTDVALRLEVTPTISPEGTIVMALGLRKAKLGGAIAVGPDEMETIDDAELITIVSAANNQTVVLGGLITKDVNSTVRKVPLLGDIPYLGKLFRHETDQTERKELLVILTPRIVESREDMDQIKQMETARMSWCLNNVVETYGDIGTYSVVSESPYIGDVPIVTPEPVKAEDLQPMLAPTIPAPMLPKKE